MMATRVTHAGASAGASGAIVADGGDIRLAGITLDPSGVEQGVQRSIAALKKLTETTLTRTTALKDYEQISERALQAAEVLYNRQYKSAQQAAAEQKVVTQQVRQELTALAALGRQVDVTSDKEVGRFKAAAAAADQLLRAVDANADAGLRFETIMQRFDQRTATAGARATAQAISEEIVKLQQLARQVDITSSRAVADFRNQAAASRLLLEAQGASTSQLGRFDNTVAQVGNRVQRLGERGAHTFKLMAGNIAVLEAGAGSSVRSLDSLLANLGLLAFSFGPKGSVAAAALVFGSVLVRTFFKFREEMEKTEQDAEQQLQKLKDKGDAIATAAAGDAARRGAANLQAQLQAAQASLHAAEQAPSGVSSVGQQRIRDDEIRQRTALVQQLTERYQQAKTTVQQFNALEAEQQRANPAVVYRDEVNALSAIASAGKLTAAQKRELTVIQAGLNAMYEKYGTDLEKQAGIARELSTVNGLLGKSEDHLAARVRQAAVDWRALGTTIARTLAAVDDARQKQDALTAAGANSIFSASIAPVTTAANTLVHGGAAAEVDAGAIAARAKKTLDQLGVPSPAAQKAAEEAAKRWAQAWDNAIAGTEAKFGDLFADLLENKVHTFSDFASQLIDIWLRTLTKMEIASASAKLVPFLSGLIHGGGGGGASGIVSDVTNAHTGGVVGSPDLGMSRSFPTALFRAAPRYHTGLFSDEMPAILKRGESVLTPGQMRALGGAMGSGTTVVHQTVQLNVQAVDGRDVSRMLSEQKGTIAQLMLEATRDSLAYRKQLVGRP